MPQLELAITRLAECSVLKVSGPIDKSAVGLFKHALRETAGFSAMPSLIDLRDVDYIHPRAIGALLDLWKGAEGSVELEVLVRPTTVTDLDDTLEP